MRRLTVKIAIIAAGVLAVLWQHDLSAAQTSADQGQAQQPPPASTARNAVLYEEDPADPYGKAYAGSVVWRSATAAPASGSAADREARAEVEIPARGIKATVRLRRNAEPISPSSHTFEIAFDLPPDFSPGGAQNVPGILMKSAQQARGVPLTGVAVKIATGLFEVRLSNEESNLRRNLDLLKEHGWFDIPIVYNNGRRAILTLEKAGPVFDELFNAWGQ